MNSTLGKRISTLRRENKLKQDELAEKLGVSSQAVSKWENDQTCPDISLVVPLAKALGVTTDELLTGETAEAPTVKMLSESERKNIKDMMLRIAVKSADGAVVNVNLPIAVIEALVDSGLNMSQFSGNEALKNIDLTMIMNMVKQGAIGNIVEIKSPDGDTVQIFVE